LQNLREHIKILFHIWATQDRLNNSIKGLTSLSASSGIGGLQSQLQKIEGNLTAPVDSAKSDFPSETIAIQTSVDQFRSAVQAPPSGPSAAQIATVAGSASRVVTSLQAFSSATGPKCG
jgi:hypothetical protein